MIRTIFMKRKVKNPQSEYEECALCHKLTEVNKNTPVECRQHYIYGVGQLCLKCNHKVYCKK